MVIQTELFEGKAGNIDLISTGITDSTIGKGEIASLSFGKGNVLSSTVTESFLFPFTKITGLTDIGGKEAFDQAFGATMTSVGQGANTHEVGNAVAM